MTHWKQAPESWLHAWVSAPRLGLITDVDGTISPIAPTPEAAQVTPEARRLLAALGHHLTLVGAISGRGAADVYQRVGVPGLVVVGNHGMERWTDGAVQVEQAVRPYLPAVAQARDRLADAIAETAGARLEDKGATLSLHYRQSPDPESTRLHLRPLVRRVVDETGLRVFEGRMIFELRPPVPRDKGVAFTELVREYTLDAAVYLGDDTTDVDAILAARALRQAGTCNALGLGVLADETPPAVADAADYTLDGIPDVEAFLAWVLEARLKVT